MATTSTNIDVKTISSCDVSIVRFENLMIQTQTAISCEIIKNKMKFFGGERHDKQQLPNHARERARQFCVRSGTASDTEFTSSVLESVSDKEVKSGTSKLEDPQ